MPRIKKIFETAFDYTLAAVAGGAALFLFLTESPTVFSGLAPVAIVLLSFPWAHGRMTERLKKACHRGRRDELALTALDPGPYLWTQAIPPLKPFFIPYVFIPVFFALVIRDEAEGTITSRSMLFFFCSFFSFVSPTVLIWSLARRLRLSMVAESGDAPKRARNWGWGLTSLGVLFFVYLSIGTLYGLISEMFDDIVGWGFTILALAGSILYFYQSARSHWRKAVAVYLDPR